MRDMGFQPPKRVLVTGGAGYIGSHMVLLLAQEGFDVVALDNLSRGHAGAIEAVSRAFPQACVKLIRGEILDGDLLAKVLEAERIDSVIHFAALAYVGESVTRPLDYWGTNLGGTLSLLGAMASAGVQRLVFSSTCSTYGEPGPEAIPISESCPQVPVNPYGRAKLAAEQAIADHARARGRCGDGFSFALLRYFNVIGSDPLGRIGEDHDPETHLIPSCLQAVMGRRGPLEILGTDYPTPDGTCIRDYVDVMALCQAHLAVLKAMGPEAQWAFNVGTGEGHSVRQVIAACQRVCGSKVPCIDGARREGDPAMLVADPRLLERTLAWKAPRTTLDESIAAAWRWMRANPRG